jgi:hypothetical protein
MPITIRIDDDVATFLEGRGKFREDWSDVLRRELRDFPASDVLRRELADSPNSVRFRKQKTHSSYPQVCGHPVSTVVRAMGAAGWNIDDANLALSEFGITANPAMLKTQIGWGRQWGKGNPHCKTGAYGTKPPSLTKEQWAELNAARDRRKLAH